MRIDACRIEAYGPFSDRVFDDLDHSVVVIQGPNEAGKTSLFHFFQEMLYGIEPTDASLHPYARRTGGAAGELRLEGQLRYHPTDGARRTVHRRLVGAPQARLTQTGSSQPVDLQNRPLPAVAHVPREVFASVHALTGRTLGELRGIAQEEVQARLLRMVSAPGVRPAGEGVSALEEEAARLWTPSGAGDGADSRATHLEEQCRALRSELERAQTHDRERRRKQQAIAELTDRLEALEAERADLKAHLRRAERLKPVHTLVSKMEAHADRAGDLAPFADVPEEPRPVLDRLGRKIDRYAQEAAKNEQARTEAQVTRDAFTDEDRRVEAEADTIRACREKASVHERRAEHREELLREMEQITRVLDERAQRLFGVAWRDSLATTLRGLPESELETRVGAYRRSDDAVEALEVRADTLARKVDRRKRLWPWGGAGVAGVVLFAAGLVLGRTLLWGVGISLAVTGLLQTLNAWSYNRERTERLGELDLEIEDAKEERAEKSAAVAELLDDLPLSEEEAAHPDHELWGALQELHRQLGERDALRHQADALGDTLGETEASVAALARRCGQPQPDGAALSRTAAALEKRLEAAEARHREADDAVARLTELRRRRHEIEPALEERRHRYEALRETLHQLKSDTEDAIEELEARRRAARRADQARDTLFRDHPDWEAQREEIRALEDDADGWAYTDDEVVRMKERREVVEDEIAEAGKQRAHERKEADRLSQSPAPADVDSKLAAARRRLDAAGRERDRFALLANVLRRADRAFRLKHQPDVVKQAGRYLRTITGGRYHRLSMEGEAPGLQVYRSNGAEHTDLDTPEATPQAVAAPLSEGLRDQVYVALRLALLDHLDRGQEALPVLLDEVFTTWDRGRRKKAYMVLEELAERRQVFVFTCHPALSEEMSRRLGAHRLLLEAPRDDESRPERDEKEKAASARV